MKARNLLGKDVYASTRTAYPVHYAGKDGWSDWVQPIRKGYKAMCCDCRLVHEFQFRLEGQHIQFRARRNNRSTAAARRKRA